MTTKHKISLLFYLNILVILFFSLKPADLALNLGSNDKIGHFSAYFTLALLYCCLNNKLMKQLIFIMIAIACGLLIEFIQSFIPNREMSLLDALTNTAGLISGLALNYLFQKNVKYLLYCLVNLLSLKNI